MAVIEVRFSLPSRGAGIIYAELDDNMTAEQILQELATNQLINPPITDYVLIIKKLNRTVEEQSRTLEREQSLAEAGIRAHDQIIVSSRLRLIPEQERGGGPPDPWVIAATLASITQVILMVVDLWSRKAKQKKVRMAKISNIRAWDEIKEIRVLMSDGSSVQFNSWLNDPNEVKSFLGVFHLPSGSPKPIRAVFVLENGSKVQLDVSNNSESNEQLNYFINTLNIPKI